MTGEEAQALEDVKAKEFTIYSVGVCYSSVCTSLSPEDATARINVELPTGVGSRWEIADKAFKTGEANPCPCDQRPETHKHFLFSC